MRPVIGAVLLALTAACHDGVRSPPSSDADPGIAREGEPCSLQPDADPQFLCSMYHRCVTTYGWRSSADGALRPAFVCRYDCVAPYYCPRVGDICCPAEIHSAGQVHPGSVCAPPSRCETLPDAGP